MPAAKRHPLLTSASRIALAALVFAAAAPARSAEPAARPVRLIMPTPPNLLDPHLDATAVGSSILGNLYDSLIEVEDGQPRASLAVAWEQPNPRTWRFRLRPGVRFHDGRPLDAAAVVAALERARSHPQSRFANDLATIDRVVAEDPETVRVDLATIDALALFQIGGINVTPSGDPEAIEEPVGSGPYRWVATAEDGTLRLEAFAGYWGDPPHEPRVEILFSEDQQEALERLRRGEADILTGLSASLVDEVESAGGLWVDSTLGSTVTFLVLNPRRPPFSDPLFREALDFALDRGAIAVEVYRDYARPASQMVAETIVGHHPGLPPTARNLARAKALASTAGAMRVVDLAHVAGSPTDELAGAIRAQLAELGLEVAVAPMSWPDLWQRLQASDVDLALLNWTTGSAEAAATYSGMIHSRSPSTLPLDPSDPEIDRLIEASHKTLDGDERRSIYHSIAERLAARRVYLPIVWGLQLHAVRRGMLWIPATRGDLDLAEIERPGA